MVNDKFDELVQRVQAEGYKYEYDERGAWVVTSESGERVVVERDGQVLYNQESKVLADNVIRLRDEINRGLIVPGSLEKEKDVGDSMRELIRSVHAEGYRFEFDESGAGVVSGENGERVRIERNGNIFYKQGSEALAETVIHLRDEVNRNKAAVDGLVVLSHRVRAGDDSGLKTIKIAAHIFREYDAGRMNDYVAQFLLNRLPEISRRFEKNPCGRDEASEPSSYTYVRACRSVLEINHMRHDYHGYGASMTAITKAEAIRLFDNGERVYNIYEGNTEQSIDDRRQFGQFDFYYGAATDRGNPYHAKESASEQVRQRETARRLKNLGYGYLLSRNSERILNGNTEIASIHGNELVFCRAGASEGVDIGAIYNALREVNEYVPAYLLARSKDVALTVGYYALYDSNGYVLGAKEFDNNTFHFVTWKKDRDGMGYDAGHYWEDFTKAKEDFCLRAGLVRCDRMLTEKELTVVRSSLSDFIEIDGGEYIEPGKEDVIKGVIEKIDSVIGPKVEEQARDDDQIADDEEAGYEVGFEA